jgi:hypothetical protein
MRKISLCCAEILCTQKSILKKKNPASLSWAVRTQPPKVV